MVGQKKKEAMNQLDPVESSPRIIKDQQNKRKKSLAENHYHQNPFHQSRCHQSHCPISLKLAKKSKKKKI
jgi:hypothetical protein